MHITVETAALLAQVFPALLIAILIEGRFHFTSKKRAWRVVLNLIVRIVAICSLAGATFGCLWAVIHNAESTALDVGVGIAFFGSFVGTLLMISDVIDKQLDDAELRSIAEDAESRSAGGIEETQR